MQNLVVPELDFFNGKKSLINYSNIRDTMDVILFLLSWNNAVSPSQEQYKAI